MHVLRPKVTIDSKLKTIGLFYRKNRRVSGPAGSFEEKQGILVNPKQQGKTREDCKVLPRPESLYLTCSSG